MYTRVLVGVDGSATAARAGERAITLAAECAAELHVVDVVTTPSVGVAVGPAGADAITRRLAGEVERASEALRSTHQRAQAAGLDAVTHLAHGEPAAAIIATADAIGADVIVVGDRGIDASGRYVLGSVPETVLFGASCDVLVVRTG